MTELLDQNTSSNRKPLDLLGPERVITFSIISIVISLLSIFLFGFILMLVSGVLAIIALINSNQIIETYLKSPEKFTHSSYAKARAGRVLAIIGICLFGIMLFLNILGWVLLASM